MQKRKEESLLRRDRTEKNGRPPKIPLLPRETLEIVERGEMLISGVLGIEGYSPENIRIRTAKGFLCICGKALTLCWAGEKRLLLKGKIEGVSFL